MTHDEIKGLHRTFPFYISFPKDEWGLIEQAEKMNPEGDRVYEILQGIYKKRYM